MINPIGFTSNASSEIDAEIALKASISSVPGLVARSGTSAEFAGVTGRFTGDKYYDTTIGREYVWDGAVWSQTYLGRSIQFASTIIGVPAKSSVYGFGINSLTTYPTPNGAYRFKFNKSGVLTSANISTKVNATLSTTESSVFSIKNITTTVDYAIISNINFAANNSEFSASGLTIPINATDLYEFSMTNPNWDTAPTNVAWWGMIAVI